jgi:hypothetical protein
MSKKRIQAAYYGLIKWNARVGLNIAFIGSNPSVRADLDISTSLLDNRERRFGSD